jgi:hypothetical protein
VCVAHSLGKRVCGTYRHGSCVARQVSACACDVDFLICMYGETENCGARASPFRVDAVCQQAGVVHARRSGVRQSGRFWGIGDGDARSQLEMV